MLIAGGRLVDPSQQIDAKRDLRIDGGIVVEIGEHLEPAPGEDVIDALGALVAPGFIDMHVHLREPGFPEKETIATGTLAALRGGFSAVACMPNTEPAIDTPEVVRMLAQHPQACCRIYPIAAITRARAGEELLDYAALAAAGAVGFSDDGVTVANARVLRDAAIKARDVRGPFISHAEDEDLKGDAVMHLGAVSRALGVRGSPGLAEDVIVARDLLVARDTGKAWHIAHVSTQVAIELVARAKNERGGITCEATPHHLLLSDDAVRELGASAKVNPPLRSQDDVRALRDAVRSGVVDALATDHAPHTAAEKSGDLQAAAVGFAGLEIAVGAYALSLPDLPLPRFVELLSTNPARILGIPGGTLKPGVPADITIFAERSWRVEPEAFASKGKSTPFAGRTFPRMVLATIVGGELRYRA
jgi:dihydroorotase